MDEVDNMTYYYVAKRCGNGWHLSNFYATPGLVRFSYFLDNKIIASETNLTLSKLQKYVQDKEDRNIYCIPYYLDLEYPGEWHQVIYVCKDKDDLLHKLQNSQDICGKFVPKYNWLGEIPLDELKTYD